MDEAFIRELRKALNHLYDPESLIKSPLCALLGVTGSFDKAISMQHILEEAIQRLKPGGDSSVYSHGAQVYKFLVYRYLQQFSLKEVADELGVSQSQLYRIQQEALRDLTIDLWQKYDLGTRWSAMPEEQPGAGGAPFPEKENLAWLSQPSPERVADLASTLKDVIDLMRPVLEQRQIELTVQLPEELPEVAVHPVALRQVLLNLINSWVNYNKEGCLGLEISNQESLIILQIEDFCSSEEEVAASLESDANLQVAKQFISLSGGEVSLETVANHLALRLIMPALEGLPVLVIDDNLDHLQLLKRFLKNTPYQLFSTADPVESIQLAVKIRARAILIDVLMPRVDGWAVLHNLRSHPSTAHLPVIVCSIIPSKDLALSLSADAFLQKPIYQDELLRVLDHWVKPAGIKPGKPPA